MCGIVGYIGPNASRHIKEMNQSQFHRGPDSDGIYIDNQSDLALAMRRLAILDIAGGVQPIISEGGRYIIVYNGEIFNSPELKSELEKKGEIFSTDHSDTEVLFKLLIREGKEALSKLNGMFAFTFYDKKEGKLLMARDRYGIKPLYYSNVSGNFAFSSELKSLTVLPEFDKSLNLSSFYSYLSLQYVVGENAIFKTVKRLQPGHLLEYDLTTKDYKIEKWWHGAYEPVKGLSREEWVLRIREELEKAVMRWSLSDVPLAISLSGGLDSSAIAGICAKNNIKLHAYSLGFEGTGEDAWNELPLARKVAQKWNLEYNETVLKPEAILDKLENMVEALDEPYGGGLPSWFIYESMKDQVKVAHTGTGGDEMFGNYGKWQGLEGRFLSLIQKPRKSAFSSSQFDQDFFQKYYYFSDLDKKKILSENFLNEKPTSHILYELLSGNSEVYTRDSFASMDISTQLPDEFLLMTDRFSMAHSIEARTPFLDNEFTDMVRQIPSNIRTNRRDLKGLLREAVKPFLPAELLTAPKKGFVIPLGLWMRNELRDVVEELLGPKKLKEQGLIQENFYDEYVKPHMNATSDHTNKLWTLLMFQLWFRRYGG